MEITPRSSVSHKPWLTDELLQMFEHEGMISGSGGPAGTRRTTKKGDTATAPLDAHSQGLRPKPTRTVSEKQTMAEGKSQYPSGRGTDEDVLVDALAEFMRPGSQSTIRTRQTRAGGQSIPATTGGGLTQKQLAALEGILHYILTGSISTCRRAPSRLLHGAKEIRPKVNMTKAAMRIRRVEFEDESQENDLSSLRPLHPIMISRRFNRVRDDLKRTLVPPRNDPEMLRRFRRGNYAVPARELAGISANYSLRQ